MDKTDLIEQAKELFQYGAGHDDSFAGAIQQAQALALISIAESLEQIVAQDNVEFSTRLYKPAEG